MTVAELIAELQKLPPDARVVAFNDEFGTLDPARLAFSAKRNAAVVGATDGSEERLTDSEYAELFM